MRVACVCVLYVCVHVYGTFICLCVCIWRPEVNFGYGSLSLSIFLRQSLSLNLELMVLAQGWPDPAGPGSLHTYPYSALGLQMLATQPDFLHKGTRTQVFMLAQPALYSLGQLSSTEWAFR